MTIATRSVRHLAAATVVACPIFLWGLHVDSLWVRLPAKPWPHLVLVAWILANNADAYGRRIAAAIALCMVADILLEFRDQGFVAGMVVFFTAHLALASAFTMRCDKWLWWTAVPVTLWLGAALAVLAPGLGAMRFPVLAYMSAIGLMMWRAAAVAIDVGQSTASKYATPVRVGVTAARLALAGAVVFGLSDTIIAMDRFHAPLPAARYVIILTYWAALALIATSAVRPESPIPVPISGALA